MKNLIRSAFAAATLSLALTAFASAAEVETGAIDIGQLMPSAKGKFVEINLSPALLKFAARIAARQEPETAELIRNLKSIRVNVVGLDDSNRAATTEQIEGVRRKLETQGWTKMVTVREQDGGDNVDIHVKQHGEESIDGLVVTVLDKKGEAVFVNIVGNINADQLAQIADKFDIEPLRKLHLKIEAKKKAKEV
ncbi:DUF4252 domain-containing protein [Opitutus sp. GAS368]|jgi:hypothetical protein|uniref:DUF4252 domain-containing protein n=1 Tax=Opitutus sp. GAS368 TaxID=1882749 RepID=UPI00087D8745|nr:DUF4252 domain-containing protein [Opitutus sp. GAS368]SDS56723.1 protein of unknown function [Opitutus sp. GAS368]